MPIPIPTNAGAPDPMDVVESLIATVGALTQMPRTQFTAPLNGPYGVSPDTYGLRSQLEFMTSGLLGQLPEAQRPKTDLPAREGIQIAPRDVLSALGASAGALSQLPRTALDLQQTGFKDTHRLVASLDFMQRSLEAELGKEVARAVVTTPVDAVEAGVNAGIKHVTKAVRPPMPPLPTRESLGHKAGEVVRR